MKKIFAGLLVLLTIATASSPCFADTMMEAVYVNGNGDESYTTYYRNYGDDLYAYVECDSGKVLALAYNDETGIFLFRKELYAGGLFQNKKVSDTYPMPSGYYRVGGYIRSNKYIFGKGEGWFKWNKR